VVSEVQEAVEIKVKVLEPIFGVHPPTPTGNAQRV